MNLLNGGIVPQEISVFGIITHGKDTLVGFSPDRKLYAVPGGGLKEEDYNLEAILWRELEEEVGDIANYELACPTPLLFYFDRDEQRVISPKRAVFAETLKLHAYFLMGAKEKNKIRQKDKNFKKPGFKPPAFFDNKILLRPSLAYAVKKFNKKKQWPKVKDFSLKGLLPNLDAIRMDMTDMNLHPDLIESLTRA